MSKVKKTLSLLLCLVMILSVCPFSAFANVAYPDGTAYAENTDYRYGSTTATNPTGITISTAGTTEIVRLNGGTGSFEYGNYVCKATPSGVPETSGGFAATLYAGETPAMPKVVLTITGTTSVANPTITCDTISGATFDEVTTTGSNSCTLTFTMSSQSVGTAMCSSGPDTDVVYTISFTYNKKQYTEYAFAHTEYILHPNGVNYYGIKNNGWGTEKARVSVLASLLSANMKPGYASSSASSTRGFINGAFGNSTEKAVPGMGSDGPQSSGAFIMTGVDSTNYSTLYNKVEDSTSNSYDDMDVYSTESADGNRIVSTVWIDKAEDHLGSGTSGTLTNGLNMRLTFKVGEYKSFYDGFVYGFQLHGNNTIDSNAGDDMGSDVSTVNTNQWTASLSGKSGNHGTAADVAAIVAQGNAGLASGTSDTGNNGWLTDYDVAANTNDNVSTAYRGFITIYMGGVGPTSSQAAAANCWSYKWCFLADGYDARSLSTDNYDDDERLTVTSGGSVRFRVYDTTNLRAVINAIENGSSSFCAAGNTLTVSYGGLYGATTYPSTVSTTLSFRGTNPQESTYAGGWDNFLAAYKRAKEVIAAFDCDSSSITHSFTGLTSLSVGLEQNAVDEAEVALINAYNNLVYQEYGTLTVKHQLADGTTVAPSQTFYGFDSTGALTTDSTKVVTRLKNNATIVANALSYIRGYEVIGTSTVTGTVSFSYVSGSSYGSTTVYDSDGNSLGSEIVFTYKASDQTLIVHPNNGYADGSVYTTPVATLAVPNFSTIKTAIGTLSHFNYAGMYETSDFSGSAVDESSWKMPPSDQNLYVNWTVKNVRLHINGVDNRGNTVAFSAGEYGDYTAPEVTTTNGIKQAGAVSLAEPATPTTSTTGYTFVAYYSDADCTNAITEWPITASYADDSAYTITENETDAQVEIYAKYVNLNNIIFLEPNGGTLPTGYEDGEVTFETGSNITYPTPTRTGYTFTGWVDKDGNPINATNASSLGVTGGTGWTVYNSEGDKEAVENGYIIMNTSLGFTAYATWTPNDIVARFRLAIPSSETSSLNSKDSSASPYYTTTVKADQYAQAEDAPNTPRRYGYIFDYWTYNSRMFKFDGTMKYPAETDDGTMELRAVWKEATDVAFADLTSYVKYGGTDYVVDEQHTQTREAMPGDTVSIRFTVSGAFYSGAQSYIFGYNSDFFETIEGVDLFTLNEDNEYIAGTHAVTYDPITTFSSAVQGMFTNKDPYTGEAVNTSYVQIAIDPDVSAMGSYKTVTMSDDTYMVEVKLRIKSSAAGTGSFWLATETLRSADNILGDTFISFTQNEGSLKNVDTMRVTFDTATVCSSIKIEVPDTSTTTNITLVLPVDESGNVLGQFADGTTALTGYSGGTTYSYSGREGSEIVETYTDTDGVSHSGFPTPTRTGYAPAHWYKVTGTNSDGTFAYDTSDEWIEGCYATTAQDGNTYVLVWEANDYTITIYNLDIETGKVADVNKTIAVKYDQIGVTGLPRVTNNNLYNLIGFIPIDEEIDAANVVDMTTYHVTGDAEFVMYTRYAQKSVTINAVVTGSDGTTETIGTFVLTADIQADLGLELRVGDVLNIVTEAPTDGSQYLLASEVVALMNGKEVRGHTYTAGMDEDEQNHYEIKTDALPTSITISATSSANVASVQYKGAMVTETFIAGYAESRGNIAAATYNGKYAGEINVSTVATSIDSDYHDTVSLNIVQWTISGEYGTAYDFDTESAGIVAPTGWTFNGWDGASSSEGTFKGETYEAKYTTKTVTVTFLGSDCATAVTSSVTNPDSTKKFNNGSYSAANKKTITAAVAKTGYTFSAWAPATTTDGTTYTAVEGATTFTATGTTYVSTYADYMISDADGNLSLYFVPTYTVKQYNVIYKTTLEGVTKPDNSLAQSVNFDATYNVNSYAADIAGYTFSGWYTDADCTGTPVAPGTEETLTTEGATWYGKYTANTYTVTFNSGKGAWADGTTKTASVAYNTDITVPTEVPTREGYIFEGWTTIDENQTTGSTTLGKLTTAGDVTYYAAWEVGTYTLTVDANGGTTTSATATYSFGDTISLDTAPTKEGNTFVEWAYTKTSDGSAITAPATMPSYDVTATAQWTVNSYDAVFDAGDGQFADGTSTKTVSTKYGEAIAEPAAPTLTGYTFTGWDRTIPSTMPAGALTFTAKYEKAKFTITYDQGEGTWTGTDAEKTEKVTYADALPATPDSKVAKEGYSLAWVYTDAAGNEYTGTTMPAYDLTATAYWTVKQYTITFNTDGGTEIEPITQNYGTTITAPADPTKTGYTFGGWSVAVPTTMPAENMTITAKWNINQYTITYMDDDGTTELGKQTYNYNAAVAALEKPTREGYTFNSWEPAEPTTMPAENITLTAKWDINPYTITFDGNEGTVSVESITRNYHESVSEPTAPTREGYTFTGWTIGDTTVTWPYTMTAENVTMTAQWSINNNNITYKFDNGDSDVTKSATFNTLLADSEPETPVRAGYTFTGWAYTAADSTAYTGTTMPDYDLTATAQWTAKTYTIIYNWNGATKLGAQEDKVTVTYSDAYSGSVASVTLPAMDENFSYIGKDFDGWYTDPGFTTSAGSTAYTVNLDNANADNEINLYAKFADHEYTITYDSNGGTETAAQTFIYGQQITEPTAPTKAGYNFTGWTYASKDTGAAYTGAKMPAYNLNATAGWTEKEYTIVFLQPDQTGSTSYSAAQTFAGMTTYTDGEGTAWNNVKVLYNQQIDSAPSTAPAVIYYNFIGWSLDGTAATIITDLSTFTADAAAITYATDGNVIYLYPVYSKAEVTLDQPSLPEGAEVVDFDSAAAPKVGYIYNAGENQSETAMDAQIAVDGYGTKEIIPSKANVCGTGAKVQVKDGVTGEVVEEYYFIVFGDVEGDAMLDGADIDIIYDMAGQNASDRTWYLADSTSMLTDDQIMKINCYTRAADTDGDNDLDSTDAMNVEGVFFGYMTVAYTTIDEDKRYLVSSI